MSLNPRPILCPMIEPYSTLKGNSMSPGRKPLDPETLLEGSWVVISRVLSPLIWVIIVLQLPYL